MTVWPPDGLWRVVGPPGGGGDPVIVDISGPLGTYPQPIPATATPLLMFTTGVVTANGNTTVWTPAAGKRFNLVGFSLWVSGASTRSTTSATQIQLRDGTAGAGIFHVIFPYILNATAVQIGQDVIYPVSLPAPYASAAVNNALTMNLGAALTAGGAVCNAWGFETT